MPEGGGFFGIFSELSNCCAPPTMSWDEADPRPRTQDSQKEEGGGGGPAFQDGARRGIESRKQGHRQSFPLSAIRTHVPESQNPLLCADCSFLDTDTFEPLDQKRIHQKRIHSLSRNTYLFSLASSGSASQLRTQLRKADPRGHRIVDCDFQVPPPAHPTT